MTGAEALAILGGAYDDRLGEAARVRAAGETVVGHFLNSVPTELILAAGLRPLRFVGDPAWRSPFAERYMEDCMDGEVRSIFGSLLEGRFATTNLLVIPRSSEVYLQLYYYLLEMARWEPDAALPPFMLFDLLQSPHWVTARYDLGRMHDFARRLSTLPGARRPDDGKLAEAIRVVNEVRRALAQAAILWRGPHPTLDGVAALRVMGAVSVLPPAAALAALEALVADPPPPLPDGRPRIMLKGSPQHDTRLTALIEDCGGRVVAHDHVAGDPCFRATVSEDGDPWEALVGHYQSAIPGPRVHPQVGEDARSLDLARSARVHGVVIAHDEWDDTLGWEYPNQRRLFEDAGMATLFLKRQRYVDPAPKEQRKLLEPFLAGLSERLAV